MSLLELYTLDVVVCINVIPTEYLEIL